MALLTDEYKEFLDELRESGAVNMFEAPRLMQAEFGLDKREARAIFSEWAKAV